MIDSHTTRRGWLTVIGKAGVAAGIGTAAVAFEACANLGHAQAPRTSIGKTSDLLDQPADRTLGRLQSVHRAPTRSATIGEAPLGLDPDRDGLRYVPAGYSASAPTPLVLMLHGANGQPTTGMRPFRELADAAGLILLAPASRRPSWDVRYGAFGPDVRFVDLALEDTYAQCNIDPARIFIAGFSDGASYALSLGLANGALFKRVIAFSPGFFEAGALQGKPPIFISHGTQDAILSIDATSRKLVPQLRQCGYTVTYQEFAGVHQVPPAIAVQARDWMLAPVPKSRN